MSSSDEEVDPAVEKLNREFQEAISKRDEANGTFTRTLIGADLSKNTTLGQLLDQSREGSNGLLVLSKKVSKFFTRGYEAGLYIMTADMPSRLRLDPTTCMWEGQPEPLPMERMLCTRACFVVFGVSARAADGKPGPLAGSTTTHSSYLAAQLMQATGDLAKRLARRGKGAEGFAQLAGLTVFVMRDGEFILSDNEGMDIPNQGFKALAGAWRELLGKRTAAQLGVTEECLAVVRRYLDRSAKALRELMEEVNASFDTSDRVVFNPLPRAKKTAKAASAGAGAGAGSGSGSGSGAGAGAGASASASSSRRAKKPALQTAKKSAKQLAQEHADRLVEALNAEFERRNKAGDTFTVAVGGLKPSKCTTLAEALDLKHDGSLGYVTLSKEAGKYFRTGMAAGQWILDCSTPAFAMKLNHETATWEGQPDADEYPEVSFSTLPWHEACGLGAVGRGVLLLTRLSHRCCRHHKLVERYACGRPHGSHRRPSMPNQPTRPPESLRTAVWRHQLHFRRGPVRAAPQRGHG